MPNPTVTIRPTPRRRYWLVSSRIVNDGCEANHFVFDAELQAQAYLLESMRRCPKRPENEK